MIKLKKTLIFLIISAWNLCETSSDTARLSPPKQIRLYSELSWRMCSRKKLPCWHTKPDSLLLVSCVLRAGQDRFVWRRKGEAAPSTGCFQANTTDNSICSYLCLQHRYFYSLIVDTSLSNSVCDPATFGSWSTIETQTNTAFKNKLR